MDDAVPSHADSILTAALGYAREGYRVLPLYPGTKVPMLTDWPNAATTDAETIATWFSGEYLGCNLGIATGPASNLIVMDVDTGHTADAAASIQALVAQNGGADLFATRTVRTPSGGFHLWFAWPDSNPDPATGELPTWRNIASTVLGPGIDLRGEGGQVAVWPSVLADGTEYARPSGLVLPMPAWLAERTKHRPKVGAPVAKVDLPDAAQGAAERYALGAINGVLADLDALASAADPNYDPARYQGLPWNETVYRAAARLRDFVLADWAPLSESDAHALLMEHAPRDPGFSDATVSTIWESSGRSHSGTPATLPESIRNPLPGFFGGGGGGGTNPTVTAGMQASPDGSPQPITLPLVDTRGKPLLGNVAKVIAGDDLAIGQDGQPWVYRSGVWSRDAGAISKRGSALLGNAWAHSYAATILDHVLADGRMISLGDGVNHDLINVRNGMLEWRTGRLLPHSPDYHSTIQLPVDFTPEATCPQFDAWVADVVSESVAARLWEVVGYMVQPGNRLQRAVLLYGSGGNGKGTFIRVLKHLLGPWNTSAVTLKSMAEGKFEVADLYGKQANLAGDIDAKYLKSTAAFKALTGEDSVQAQHKHKDPFDFVNHATPLFSANELWRSSDTSEGYRRRWLVLPMTKKVMTDGKRFNEDALLAERAGIFAHAVRALRALYERHEQGHVDPFSRSVETDFAHDEFDAASDVVRLWLAEDDRIVTHQPGANDPTTWIKRGTLYQVFRTWCLTNGHAGGGVSVLASGKFWGRLEALGYTAQHQRGEGGGRGFMGFRLEDHDHVGLGAF